jgi:hypothetical protein
VAGVGLVAGGVDGVVATTVGDAVAAAGTVTASVGAAGGTGAWVGSDGRVDAVGVGMGAPAITVIVPRMSGWSLQ